jgi:hypothetical protein
LTSIPLWEPDPDQYSLPSYTCYYTSVHSSSGASFLKFCHSNVSITTQTFLPSGLNLWCNGYLHTCINAPTPGPCLSVITVPQLTLYGKVEFFRLYSPRQPRAAFLPIMVGISLPSPIAATGLAGGALGHSVISAKDFEEHLQVTLDSTSVSPASLKRQLTSLAQVALQTPGP